MERDIDESWWDRLLWLAVAVLLIGALQWLGGAPPSSVPFIAAWSLFTATLAWWQRRGRGLGAARSRWVQSVPPLAWVLVLVAGWTVLQAWPLPCAFASWLAPDLQGHLRASASFMERSARCGLSWDPGNTRLEAVRWFGFAGAFWLGLLLGRRAWRRVAAIIVVSAAITVVVALGHRLAGLDAYFGIYRPVFARPRWWSPLLNPNHFAAYAALGSVLALALVVRSKQQRVRITWATFGALTGAAVFLSQSRWGGMTFIVTFAASLALFWRSRARHRRVPWGMSTVMAILALAMGWGLSVTWSAWLHEADQGLEKLDIVAAAWRHALEAPWVGVGRGAFTVTFLRAWPFPKRVEYAEHFPAQWVAEWGAPMATLLAAALVHALVRAWRRTRGSLSARVAWLAVVGLWMHDLLDFSQELSGVGTVSWLLLGTLTGSGAASHDASPTDERRAPGHRRVLHRAAVVAAAGGLGVFLVLGWGLSAAHEARLDQRLYIESLLDARRPKEALTAVREALRVHPLEPTFYLLGASARLLDRQPDAGRWIGRALWLAPYWAEGHRLAAVWLSGLGRRKQALLELAEAARLDARSLRRGSCPLIRGLRPEDVFAVAPEGAAGVTFVDYLAGCWEVDAPGMEELDAWLRRHDASLASPWVRAARRYHRGGEMEQAWQALREAHRRTPGDVRVLGHAAAWARSEAEYEQAARWLEEARRTVGDSMDLARIEAQLWARRGRVEPMRRAFARMRRMAGGDRRAQADVWRFRARLEAANDQPFEALGAWERAARLSGSRSDWEQVLHWAERAGRPLLVRLARRRLERRALE